MNQWTRNLALLQAGIYVGTGVWPLVHRRSFEAVTGPKVDFWLVQTVGAILSVVGAVIGLAGWKGRVTPEIRGLAVGSAASLATVDVVFTRRKRISPVYLLDAVLEGGLMAGWLMVQKQER